MSNPTRQVWASRPAPDARNSPSLLVPVRLGDQLNAGAFGGTATVHSMLDAPYQTMAAKLFNPEVLADRRSPASVAKLSFIAAASAGLKRGYVGNGHIAPARPHIAWPEALLFDANSSDPKHLVGFAMPLFGDSQPLSKLTSPKHRKIQFPAMPADGQLMAAQNIAAAVLDLHGPDGRSGILIGDLTPRNVLITPELCCQLIDADSFQFGLARRFFGSGDTTPGFRSPRMALASRAGGAMPPFTHADDAYCLAMVLFQVLVDGAQPWTAGERFEVNGIKPDEEDNMLARRFPYADPATCYPPKIRLQTYQKLPLAVRLTFERAFLCPTVPTPQEWVHILTQERVAVNPMSSGRLTQNRPDPVAAAG